MIWLLVVPCATLVVFGGYILGYGLHRLFARKEDSL